MLFKEIFSKKSNSLEKNFQIKMFNISVYSKSLVRTMEPLNKQTESVVDNNYVLLNLFKSKTNTLKSFKGKNLLEKKFIRLAEGQCTKTTSFLYKNRKNEGFKFNSPILKPSICQNHINMLHQSIGGLINSNTWTKSSMLILMPKRGGFSCYASGFLGFLPKKHGSNLFCKTLLFLLNDKEDSKRLKNVLFITHKQSLSQRSTSFLLRLHCFLGKFRFLFRKKRKKFALSRKKKGKRSSYRRYTMVFLSSFNS